MGVFFTSKRFRHRLVLPGAFSFILLFLFQNCGSQFQVNPESTDLASLATLQTPLITFENSAPELINTAQHTLQFNVDNVTDAQIKSITCQLGQVAPVDCRSKAVTFNQLVDGDYQVKITVETLAGVKGETIRSFRKDATAPVLTVISAPKSVNNQTSASVSVSASDNLSGVDRFECSLNNSNFSLCTIPVSLTNLAAGNHSLKIRAYDKINNLSSVTDVTWTVDLNIPVVTLSTTPLALTNMTTANFVFSGANVASYECALDAAAFAACTSPHNLTNLAAGAHTFRVRGTSAAGNVSLPAMHSWTVELTAPSLAFSQMPPSLTNQTSATFAFSGVGVTSFECQLDNGAYTACTSPRQITGLASGAHTFRVRGTSAAGNISAPIVHSWTVDSTVPTVNLSQMPPVLTNQTSATFAFSGVGVTSFECQLDSAAFAACTSPRQITGLTAGAHTFRVRGTSAAGNVSLLAMHSWTVELTAPSLAFSQMPPVLTNQTSATFEFSSVGVTSFECQLDSAAYAACTSPRQITGLASGAHTFRVRGTSAAGNISAPIVHSWTVDSTVPTVNLTQMPPSLTNQTSATFAFSGVGVTSFECQLDSAAFAACTTPRQITGLTAGEHTFRVRGTSAAGSVSAPAQFIWNVELTASPIAFTQQPAAAVSVTTATFAFSGNNIASYECQLDNAAFVACTSPHNLTNLASGAHAFRVRGTSLAGNVSPVITHSWTVNLAPPTVTIISGPTNPTRQSTANFNFSGTNAARFECQLNNAAFSTCTSPHGISNLAAGNHIFNVRAVSSAGLVSTMQSFNWSVELVASPIAFTQQPPAMVGASTATFAFSGNNIASYECQLDDAAFVACTSPHNLTNLASGAHAFRVRGVSLAGNISPVITHNWTVSLTPPTVTILSEPTNPTNQTTANFNFSGTNAVRFECQLNNAAFSTCTSPHGISNLAAGNHIFNVRAVSSAGLVSTMQSFNWSVDLSPPSAPVLSTNATNPTIPERISRHSSPSFSFNSTDNIGVTGYQCSLNNSAFSACTSVVVLGEPQFGSNTYRVRAMDAAGNVSPISSYDWWYDNVLPTVPNLTHNLTGTLTNQTSVTFNFSSTDVGLGVASYRCVVDGVNINPCTSPLVLNNLMVGDHRILVAAIDLVSNESSFATLNWAVTAAAPPTPPKIKLVSGDYHSCLLINGAVKCWGYAGILGDGVFSPPGSRTTTAVTVIASGATDIAIGYDQSCAILTNGSLQCWGRNFNGQVGDGTTIDRYLPVTIIPSGVTDISLAYNMGCAIASGSLLCWGSGFGPTSSRTPVLYPGVETEVITDLALGNEVICVIVLGGALKCADRNTGARNFRTLIASQVVEVSSGKEAGANERHTCARTSNNSIYCWGNTLQNGINFATPTVIFAGTGITTGSNNAFFLTGNALYAVGANYGGVLGDRTTTERLVPTLIYRTGVTAISSSGVNSCAVLNSEVQCWGDKISPAGQPGLPVRIQGLN